MELMFSIKKVDIAAGTQVIPLMIKGLKAGRF
jgi:hypothetical protein